MHIGCLVFPEIPRRYLEDQLDFAGSYGFEVSWAACLCLCICGAVDDDSSDFLCDAAALNGVAQRNAAAASCLENNNHTKQPGQPGIILGFSLN